MVSDETKGKSESMNDGISEQIANAAVAARFLNPGGTTGTMDTTGRAMSIAAHVAINRGQNGHEERGPRSGDATFDAYAESLENHAAAQEALIEALRGEIVAKDELIGAKGGVIEALSGTNAQAMIAFRQVGMQFRDIADTARNIQAALRENDPRDAAEPAVDALQAIIEAADELANSIAESAYTAVAAQLAAHTDKDETVERQTEGEETA